MTVGEIKAMNLPDDTVVIAERGRSDVFYSEIGWSVAWNGSERDFSSREEAERCYQSIREGGQEAKIRTYLILSFFNDDDSVLDDDD